MVAQGFAIIVMDGLEAAHDGFERFGYLYRTRLNSWDRVGRRQLRLQEVRSSGDIRHASGIPYGP